MGLKISARKSDLARLQAYLVAKALKKENPNLEIEFLFRESLGDKNLNDPLWKMPEKGVFTEDFYQELIEEKTDLVVHSWKDLPTEGKSDTEIVATLPRADQRDVLLFKKSSLQKPAVTIYSSSPRRAYNLKDFLTEALPWKVSSLAFESVRGNIPTRVRKMIEANDVDGLIVAKAALDRLLATTEEEFADCREVLNSALKEVKWMALPLSIDPNAAAQGAIAIEIKKTRQDLRQILGAINCSQTFSAVMREREILAGHGGGCHQKIGVAVLARDYGHVLFEKGLTDKGVVLDRVWIPQATPPRFPAHLLWSLTEKKQNEAASSSVHSTEQVIHRKALATDWRPKDGTGVWVARASAWKTEFQFPMAADIVVCAAGVKTWLALASQNVWVNACADSLGENEPMQIEFLCGPREWTKLSHTYSDPNFSSAGHLAADFSVNTGSDPKMKLVATYQLDYSAIDWQIDQQKFFFWKSGSSFQAALQKFPEIRTAMHACGVGSTYQTIKKFIRKENIFVFWNEDDWRKQCTI